MGHPVNRCGGQGLTRQISWREVIPSKSFFEDKLFSREYKSHLRCWYTQSTSILWLPFRFLLDIQCEFVACNVIFFIAMWMTLFPRRKSPSSSCNKKDCSWINKSVAVLITLYTLYSKLSFSLCTQKLAVHTLYHRSQYTQSQPFEERKPKSTLL